MGFFDFLAKFWWIELLFIAAITVAWGMDYIRLPAAMLLYIGSLPFFFDALPKWA